MPSPTVTFRMSPEIHQRLIDAASDSTMTNVITAALQRHFDAAAPSPLPEGTSAPTEAPGAGPPIPAAAPPEPVIPTSVRIREKLAGVQLAAGVDRELLVSGLVAALGDDVPDDVSAYIPAELRATAGRSGSGGGYVREAATAPAREVGPLDGIATRDGAGVYHVAPSYRRDSQADRDLRRLRGQR
jgi:hypothetical protein